ncbi:hypothetical protein B0H14DRAFT_2598709 [Mycena olivaceomarginata]|nr:hypothetical protein B0H14DRAFT_2598709 [Mycena olivaceomarginata]
MTSSMIIRDILLGHHVSRSRISVFHSDLHTIQRSLDLNAIPHANMTLVQCRHALLHHITTGACADHTVDAGIAPRPDRSACCVLCQDFESAADMAEIVLNIILDADDKHISTESLSHVAAALNLSVARDRNLRFKLCSAIRKHTEAVTSADVDIRSSASIADFFDSSETHRKPILLSIAALHRIEVPEKLTIESLCSQITEHFLSGHCTQFSDSHPAITLRNGLVLPDWADVQAEWLGSKLDVDLQFHILNAVYGSKISLNSLRRVLSNLGVEYTNDEIMGQLHRRLKGYIVHL